MTLSFEALRLLLHIHLWIVAICTTAFPLVWAFSSRWWSTLLGRLVMLQGVALAFLVDLTLFFKHVDVARGEILFAFWPTIIVYSMLASASVLLTWTTIRMNYIHPKRKEESQDD